MPIVHVEIAQGRADAEKKAILDGIHDALVECFKIPETDRNQVLREVLPEHLDSNKGKGFTLVELTVFPGRSAQAKGLLYKAIVRNLERAAHINPMDVMIVLHEPPLENWGIRGGEMASQVELGFKIDV
jgi:phenylpyruvate tautomerase PptA (4-oxalocrotonate tautomerase family)